jgi:hypothetical protein
MAATGYIYFPVESLLGIVTATAGDPPTAIQVNVTTPAGAAKAPHPNFYAIEFTSTAKVMWLTTDYFKIPEDYKAGGTIRGVCFSSGTGQMCWMAAVQIIDSGKDVTSGTYNTGTSTTVTASAEVENLLNFSVATDVSGLSSGLWCQIAIAHDTSSTQHTGIAGQHAYLAGSLIFDYTTS